MADNNTAATLQILLDIRARLDELTKAQTGMRAFREETARAGKEGEGFWSQFREGLGIGAGMFTIAKGVEIVKETIKETVGEAVRMAQEIKDSAANLGIDTTSYQALRVLVQETGGDVMSLTGALNAQQRALVDASNDAAGPAAAAFAALGLSVAQLQGMTLDRQFEAVARAIDHANNKQEAFRAAAQVLGERHLPRLREALRELGEEGYDKVKDKAEASIMSPEAIARLSAAAEATKRVKEIFVAKIGEDLASLLELLGQPKPEMPEQTGPTPQEVGAARQLADQQQQLEKSKARLNKAQIDAGKVSDDVTLTEIDRQKQLDAIFDRQISALQTIYALRKAMPLAQGETQAQRDAEVAKIDAALAAAQNAARKNLGAGPTDYQTRVNQRTLEEANLSPYELNTKRASEINNPDKNPDYLTTGQGMMSGLAGYVNSVGSTGDQVANTLQSTIGSEISNLSDGITGLITGTKTWGDVGRSAGLIFLQALVQLGIQMLAQKALTAGVAAFHTAMEGEKTAATIAGEGARTGATATGTAARSALHIAETIVHGVQVAIRVAAHLAGEVIQTGITIVQSGLRIASIIAESLVYLVKAAIGAMSAMASIPYVGPILAIAAMAAIIAAGSKLLKGHSEGGYTGDGGKYEPAGIVHRGEVVFSQADIARHGGVDAVESLRKGSAADRYLVAAPAASGEAMTSRNGGASTAASIAQAASSRPTRYIHVMAPDMISARRMSQDPEFDNVMLDWGRRNRGVLAG